MYHLCVSFLFSYFACACPEHDSSSSGKHAWMNVTNLDLPRGEFCNLVHVHVQQRTQCLLLRFDIALGNSARHTLAAIEFAEHKHEL